MKMMEPQLWQLHRNFLGVKHIRMGVMKIRLVGTKASSSAHRAVEI
jgi:hypothetical protein